MPIKHICGKCGSNMTDNEFRYTRSIGLISSFGIEMIVRDLCKNCQKTLTQIIEETVIKTSKE